MPEARLRATTTTAALAVVATAAAASGVAAAVASVPWHTTYAGLSSWLSVLDVAAAAGLLVGGTWLSLERPRDVRGPVSLVLVACWSATQWVGWQGGPEVMRSLGVLAGAALLPLVSHLVVRTWPDSHALRSVVPWLYAVSVGLAAARLAVYDPLTDPDCWQNCTVNPVLVNAHHETAAALARVSAGLSTATGLALVGVGVCLAVLGRPAERSVHLPVIAPGAGVGAVAVPFGLLSLVGISEDPRQQRYLALHGALAMALAGTGAGIALVAARIRLATGRARQLAHELAWSSRQPVSTLVGGAIGDPSVTVTYRATDPPEWVDATGRTVPPPELDARGTVPVTREGRLVAAIRHDPDAAADLDLATALGPAGRLAVENEALQARQQARLRDLVASQRRIVEAADAERSRLERNLHDAAQVSVLALTGSVHRALRLARDAGEEQAARTLQHAAEQVQGVMDELRALAGSIHPAMVETAGLGPALHALADRAPLRVEVLVPDGGRLPSPVERAAYAAAREVLRAASTLGEDDLQLRVAWDSRELTLVVDGTAQQVSDALRDRAGAAGGEARSTGARVEVTLPCA